MAEMDKKVRRKLAQMGGKLISKDQQTKKLKALGKNSGNNLSSGFFENLRISLDEDKSSGILVKIDLALDIIKINIKLSKGHKNFDIDEYKLDKEFIFNIKTKYQSTGIKPLNKELKAINKIFNKHKRITKLLSDK